jgi:hypothetical protein
MSQLTKTTSSRLACALTLLAASAVNVAAPVSVDYSLTSLAAPGRYQYSYTLTNVSLATPVSWFSVDFDPALFDEASLAITSTGLGNWTEQILGSVPGLPALYDAYKTKGTPVGIGDFEAGFKIEFTWLGAGTPGNQAFTVYDPATLAVLDTGLTTLVGVPPPTGIPEPSSLMLVLLALGTTAALSRPTSKGTHAQSAHKSGVSMPALRVA